MAALNRVFLIGNLTRDVEIKHTPSNMAVGNFGLAVNRKWGDKEEVTFIDCTAWGKVAEIMSQHLHKGASVFLEGRLTLDQWEDKNGGGKRSKLFVTVENFQFLDKKVNGAGSRSENPQERRAENEDEWGDSDNIPF